jgi:RsiW-degrading membrane proteinase PrsW (M82 family)
MEGTFTVQLFDLLIYLIPGTIAAIGIYLLTKEFIPKEILKNSTQNILLAFVLIFFLGIIIHQAAGIGYSVFRRTFGFDYYEYVSKRYSEFETVKRKVESKTLEKLDSYQTYMYAKTYVLEKAKNQNSSVSRLIALCLCCRNSIIAIPFFLICLLFYLKKEKKLKRWRWLYITSFLGIMEILAIVGFAGYWKAYMNLVYRTFIIL